ncbi:MAG: alpha/beta hydrolase [Anaerolineae bacterium]
MISVEDYVNQPVSEPDARFSYGDDPNQFVELFFPEGQHEPIPVVVMVHGGCWGAKYDGKPLGGICRALNKDGWAVWNLEYRRNGIGGGYPNTFLDVARGTDLLRTVANDYKLDLSNVVAVGHSAGGHLALWLAARHRLSATSPVYTPDPLPISAVVCLAGVVDLVEAAATGLCGENLPLLLGGTPNAVPAHYHDASPKELLPLGVKQTHIVGELDEMLPNVRGYVTAAQAAGDRVELNVLPNADHFELVVPTTKEWAVVQAAVLSHLH